jgi:hypothetical protein
MSSSETVTETLNEGGKGIADRVGALSEALGPALARHSESGNLAVASGVVSLARAGRTFLKGNRKRGVVQALGGLFWIGVALAQRRSGSGPGRGSSGKTGRDRSENETTDLDLADVADSSPDVEEAVEPGGHDIDHAIGEEVVNTTDADIEESDTAPEIQSDVDGDVDQRDVVDTDDVGTADADSETESNPDDATEPETGPSTEADDDETTQAETDGGTEAADEVED